MAAEPLNSGTSDPLSEIYGPALFPRTFSASAGNPMPADYKNIDSLHQVMKSLKELRSPDKLMNEAKRIVDGGVELQESNLISFVGSVSVTHDIASKVKDKPRERRPGLGIARKKGTFSLKATVSQPHVSFEPTVKIDQLQDPDEFFDDYDRRENARKEIQRLLGGTSDNVNQQRPSLPRHRRQGILGKSYTYNHRYSSAPSENDNVLRPSQEMGDESISNSPEDVPLENVISLDFIPAVDLEDDEPAGKRTENKSSNLLNELLSYSNEDLNGDGALYHLQRLLNIKPLDLEGLRIPEVYYAGSPSTSMAGESLLKPEKDSVQVHKVLTNLNSGQTVGHELVTRSPVLHATSHSPRSPFSSMSLLMKRIVKPNPPKDPFFPHDAELSSSQKVCLVQPTDKLHEQVDTSYDLGMPDFDSQGQAEIAEAVISNSVSLKMTETKDNYSDQFVDEATGGPNRDACIMPNEEPDPNIEESKNYNNSHNNAVDNPNPSSLEDEAMEGKSTCSQNDSEQQPEPEVYQRKLHIPDKAGENRIRKAHPMRKSLADCGSSFETGVRRSKRIKMRRLEYWKGERFLYGRVDNSLKLIGVKYLSPGKGDMALKVKPYLPSESTEIKELLDLESRH